MADLKITDETILSIVEASPIGMILVDSNGRVVFANRRTGEIFGHTGAELLGTSVESLIPNRFRAHHVALRSEYTANPHARPMGRNRILSALHRDGNEIPIEVGLSPIHVNNERFILASILDLSDRMQATDLRRQNEALRLEATHDELTGLPNRRLFIDLFERLASVAIRRKSSITLMFVDLDGFKKVNDVYTHDVGDALLRQVASILSRNIRTGDIVARYGGDEFLISLTDAGDADSVVRVANKLIKEISSIDRIEGHPIKISASIGALRSTHPDQVSVADFINAADQLMYQAKKSGKGRTVYQEYSRSVDDSQSDGETQTV